MPEQVLVVLNQPSADAPPHIQGARPFEAADPAAPLVRPLDLGLTRGDGIFETISVVHGRPMALDHHLRRFAASAAKLALPAPDVEAWRSAILAAIEELGSVEEASVKTVMTRGVEGDGRPTGWVHASRSPDYGGVRREGIRVITLDRGYRHDVERTSPWLLAGAKTLSYAVNRSVLREAASRGADDVIFVSSDGFVLEGPTSTVLYRLGNRLLTPGTGLGILDGTTQASIFRYAEGRGFETGYAQVRPAELRRAEAIWLVSSVRLAAPVRELDGEEFPVDAELSAGINSYLLELG
ncbi:MAG TPA: aminodeoxychorismate lyase [Lacisediminihabitans sp.]|uniref:aminodeoxychorismate lyase n=1 Tax=Lacisediminihabitans sp. TaxID=2787631 RepID=UPI002EDA8861